MFGRNMLRGVVLSLCLVPLLSQAQESHNADYWRGWCDGRRAGLEQARRYVRTTFDEWLKGWKAPDETLLKERFQLLLHAVPFTSFGPPLDTPFTVNLSDGRTIMCPSGDILVTPPLERKG